MNFPEELKYSERHVWISFEGDIGLVGITDFAQEELGEIMFVDLPEIGSIAEADDSVAEVESSKSVSEIYTPVSGEIIEVNEQLSEEPDLINSSPYEEGWIFKIHVSNINETKDLISNDEYKEFINE